MSSPNFNIQDLPPIFFEASAVSSLLGYLEPEQETTNRAQPQPKDPLFSLLQRQLTGLIKENVEQALSKTKSVLADREIQILCDTAAKRIPSFPLGRPPEKLNLKFAPRDLICDGTQGWMLLDKVKKGDQPLIEGASVFFAIDLLRGELCSRKIIDAEEKEIIEALQNPPHLAHTCCIARSQESDKTNLFFLIQKHYNKNDLLDWLGTPVNLSHEVVAGAETLTQRDMLRFCLNTLEGICRMHERGIIHRDIKPENILCQDTIHKLSTVVGDFGVSSFKKEVVPKQTRGTTQYFPPEVCSPSYVADFTCDSWAFGLIMHQLLLGQPLFPEWYEMVQSDILNCLGDLKEHPMHKRYPLAPDPTKQPLESMLYNLLLLDPKKRMSCLEALKILRKCYAEKAVFSLE